MLALATIAVLLAGTGPIAYIRELSNLDYSGQEITYSVCHSDHGCQRVNIRVGN